MTPIRTLIVAAGVAGAVSMTPGGAKSQSEIEQICMEFDPVAIVADYDPDWARWCEKLIDQLIAWSIPFIYELDPTDVHPSTISAGIEREMRTVTAWLYNDLLYFRDADSWYSSISRHQAECVGDHLPIHAPGDRARDNPKRPERQILRPWHPVDAGR